MLLVANSRQLDIGKVLCHPLGPIPWSLANCDGSLRKTTKSSLANKLQLLVSPADVVPKPSACIIDGMSQIQRCYGEGKTFGQVAKEILNMCLRDGYESDRLDVVFDVYKKKSIKSCERLTRGSDQGIGYKVIKPEVKVTQWRRLLASQMTKTVLIEFLVMQWKTQECINILGEKEFVTTVGDTCFRITKEGCSEVFELKTRQEEADTRMLLHANHVKQKSAIVVCQDTDVLVNLLAAQHKISTRLFLKHGTKTRTQFIDITKLVSALGNDKCQALVGLHAFTGCDTTSAFTGKGKIQPLKLLDTPHLEEAMVNLGKDWKLSSDDFKLLEEFTCRMYLKKSNITGVNELRHNIFRAKRGEVESGQLPPCQDALYQHALRANFQAALWRRSLENFPEIPDTIGNGWMMENDELVIKWISGKPAPDAVLEMLACKCGKECNPQKCQCKLNKLKCTDACSHPLTCDNMDEESDEDMEGTNDDSDYSDEDDD